MAGLLVFKYDIAQCYVLFYNWKIIVFQYFLLVNRIDFTFLHDNLLIPTYLYVIRENTSRFTKLFGQFLYNCEYFSRFTLILCCY